LISLTQPHLIPSCAAPSPLSPKRGGEGKDEGERPDVKGKTAFPLVWRRALPFIVALFLGFGGCAGSTRQETPEEPVADSVLTAQVTSALATDARLRAASLIRVETSNGIVVLTGFVDSRLEADEAVAVARSVRGVKGVRDDIIVRVRPDRR